MDDTIKCNPNFVINENCITSLLDKFYGDAAVLFNHRTYLMHIYDDLFQIATNIDKLINAANFPSNIWDIVDDPSWFICNGRLNVVYYFYYLSWVSNTKTNEGFIPILNIMKLLKRFKLRDVEGSWNTLAFALYESFYDKSKLLEPIVNTLSVNVSEPRDNDNGTTTSPYFSINEGHITTFLETYYEHEQAELLNHKMWMSYMYTDLFELASTINDIINSPDYPLNAYGKLPQHYHEVIDNNNKLNIIKFNSRYYPHHFPGEPLMRLYALFWCI